MAYVNTCDRISVHTLEYGILILTLEYGILILTLEYEILILTLEYEILILTLEYGIPILTLEYVYAGTYECATYIIHMVHVASKHNLRCFKKFIIRKFLEATRQFPSSGSNAPHMIPILTLL